MNRQPGYYWVKKENLGDTWIAAHWESYLNGGAGWWIPGEDSPCADYNLTEINETRIPSPDEAKESGECSTQDHMLEEVTQARIILDALAPRAAKLSDTVANITGITPSNAAPPVYQSIADSVTFFKQNSSLKSTIPLSFFVDGKTYGTDTITEEQARELKNAGLFND